MTPHYSLGRESFQKFLDNAFTVQQSGLDRQFLSALIGIQQFVKSQEFDVGRTMQRIVERALKVSAASGVAIALLEGSDWFTTPEAGQPLMTWAPCSCSTECFPQG